MSSPKPADNSSTKIVQNCPVPAAGKLIVWLRDGKGKPLSDVKVIAQKADFTASVNTQYSYVLPYNEAIANYGRVPVGTYRLFVEGHEGLNGHPINVQVTADDSHSPRDPHGTLVLPVNTVTPHIDIPRNLVLLPGGPAPARDAADPADPTGSPSPVTVEVYLTQDTPATPYDGPGELSRSNDKVKLYTDQACTAEVAFAGDKLTISKADLTKNPKLKYYAKGTALGEMELTLKLTDPKKPSVVVKEAVSKKLGVVTGVLKIHRDDNADVTGELSADDKMVVGRDLHVQDGDKRHGRAKLEVLKPDPAFWSVGGSASRVVIKTISAGGAVEIFKVETGGSACTLPLELSEGDLGQNGIKLWVEGKTVSNKRRDVQVCLGLKSANLAFDQADKNTVNWVAATVLKIKKVTPDTDDHKQYINLAADVAHPEYSRDYKPKAHLEKALSGVKIRFSLEPDAGNKTGLKAGLENTVYQAGTRITKDADATGVAESDAMTLSAYGGDVFQVGAEIAAAPVRAGAKPVLSKKITIWRRLEYNDVYTMDSENYIDTATAVGEIQPAFTPAFIEYTRGAVQTLAANLTVKYIGLFRGVGSQRAWPNDLSPASLETAANELVPTAAELAAYGGANAVAKAAAKTAIEAKAQLWFDRVTADYGSCVGLWFAAVGALPGNSLLAVQYYHPKLSGQADGVTNFWPAGISINAANPGSGLNTPVHPDQHWRVVQGFNQGTTSVVFKNYGTAARLQIVCRHEIGHATKGAFGRDDFGVGDHSASALMTPFGASNVFSNADINLLRGWKA